jgi:hypothetical protein
MKYVSLMRTASHLFDDPVGFSYTLIVESLGSE